jgi:hypothetical protein
MHGVAIMHKSHRIAVGIAIASSIVALSGLPAVAQTPAPPATNTTAAAPTDCTAYAADTALTAEMLQKPILPPCAQTVTPNDPDRPDPLDALQHGFDLYSWLTFVGLNSPADGTTPIGKGPGPGGDAPTVWETYKQLTDVMLPNGQQTEWTAPHGVPDACKPLAGSEAMVVQMIEETFDQPFKSGPLVDQDGNYALFVILMNKPMFDYIETNGLYSREGQMKFKDRVDFPRGSMTTKPAVLNTVMIKASWKVLGANDKDDEFHKINALVYTPPSHDGKVAATCVARKLGLVGFHVGHKTDTANQWVWTTFEHVRNVPTQPEVDSGEAKTKHYSFYNPACDTATCPVNQTPPWPWDPHQPPPGFKSQIVRVVAPSDDVVNINKEDQALPNLKGTVWEHYELISTQWPTARPCALDTDPSLETDPTCAPAPIFLANATLETFSQADKAGGIPLATSTCIGCHNNATTQHDPATRSDFTYILEKAQ